jgi:hypothetical protein
MEQSIIAPWKWKCTVKYRISPQIGIANASGARDCGRFDPDLRVLVPACAYTTRLTAMLGQYHPENQFVTGPDYFRSGETG